MDAILFITFVITSVGIIIIPGPNVLVIVSTSLKSGKLRGLQTVAGTSLAMCIQLIISAFATAWFIGLLADGFYILKWLGVAYLLYLGLHHLKNALYRQNSKTQLTASASFSRGFVVSLTNPKTILFFGAFLPQFVSSTGNYFQQIVMLSITFLLIAIALDSCYALLAVKLRSILEQRKLARLQNLFSGLLFCGASAWLATVRRIN